DPGAFHTDFANPNPGDGPSAVTCQIGAFATAWADNDTFTFWVRDETAGVGGYLDGQGTTDPVINDGAVHYDGWSGAIGGSQAAIQPIVASGIDSNMPLETSLEQNYPNPFNPTTTINFSIVEAGNVSMNVYNFSGQLVRSLVNGQMNAGMHTANFDASNLSAGVYYYTLEANNMTMTNKMILVK
nr:T9SS type A sorting domain-containing protein [Candidatus Delongbacteria bacterium]